MPVPAQRWSGDRLGVGSPCPSIPFLGPSLDTYSSGIVCVCVYFGCFFAPWVFVAMHRLFLVAESRGSLLLSCSARASLIVQHGSREQAVAPCGLYSFGLQIPEHRLNSCGPQA